jgi:hypothetical protein
MGCGAHSQAADTFKEILRRRKAFCGMKEAEFIGTGSKDESDYRRFFGHLPPPSSI